MAGSDNAAVPIRSSVYRVLQTPGVYDKMMKELDEAYSAGRISKPVVTYDECVALPYFNAVIKEILRLDPSVPANFPRVAPKGGYHLNGLYVPEGTVVCTDSWVINRNKHFYGEDAEVFNPERWLVSEERSKTMENHSFTWGHGQSVCIGKHIALMEAHKAIFQVCIYLLGGRVLKERHGLIIHSFSYILHQSLSISSNMESEKTL